MTLHRENFWHFSNQIYRRPGVAETCLDLQHSKGADVNLLLFACWYGVSRGLLPEELIKRSLDYSQRWSSNVVVPLRQARTWMKQSEVLLSDNRDVDLFMQQYRQLRQQIKATELQAEHVQQTLLESMLDDSQVEAKLDGDEVTQGQHVRTNLLHYLPAQTDPQILKLLSDNAVAIHHS
jgi:uncharacterized protein (TIGR02444 family)